MSIDVVLLIFLLSCTLWFPYKYLIKKNNDYLALNYQRPFVVKQNNLTYVVKTNADFENCVNVFNNVHNLDLLNFCCIDVVKSTDHDFEQSLKLPVFSSVKKSTPWKLSTYLSGNIFCCNNNCEQGQICPMNKPLF